MEKGKHCGKSFVDLSCIVNIISNIIENLLAVVLAIVFIVTCLNVILRYAFNTSIYGGQEMVEYLFIYLTALGSALLIKTDEHIFVDFFTNAPTWFRKTLLGFKYIVIIALQAFLLLKSIYWINNVGKFPTPLLHIEQRWIQYSIPCGMILGILFSLWQLSLIKAESEVSPR